MSKYDELRTLKPEGAEAYMLEGQEYRPVFKNPWTREELRDLSNTYQNRFREDLKAAGILISEYRLDGAYVDFSSGARIIPRTYAIGAVTNVPEKKFEVVEQSYQVLLKDILSEYTSPKCVLVFREDLLLMENKTGRDVETGNIDSNFKLIFFTRIAHMPIES